MTEELFAGVAGQDHVVSYLNQVVETSNATHAYLLAGGNAQDARDLALRFASALIAGGDEEAHSQALRLVHPDLHVYSPGGAESYLVEQIRELTHDAELAPIRARHKVYVIQDAQRLAGAPANAFLKTLEEPPENVTCILVANSEAAVLETLRSRCEVLVLNAASSEIVGDARISDTLYALFRGIGNQELLAQAKDFVEAAREKARMKAGDGIDAEAYIEKYGDYLSQGAKKQIEQQEKREDTARERATLLLSLDFARRWLRDCVIVREGAEPLLSYGEHREQTTRVAESVPTANLLRAIDAVGAASSRISYNVTPQLAIEAMFLEIREALCRK